MYPVSKNIGRLVFWKAENIFSLIGHHEMKLIEKVWSRSLSLKKGILFFGGPAWF